MMIFCNDPVSSFEKQFENENGSDVGGKVFIGRQQGFYFQLKSNPSAVGFSHWNKKLQFVFE